MLIWSSSPLCLLVQPEPRTLSVALQDRGLEGGPLWTEEETLWHWSFVQ